MCAAPATHNNRTGSSLNEQWLNEMLEGTKEFPPKPIKMERTVLENRARYAKGGAAIGTYPPLGNPEPFLGSTEGEATDRAMDVFMDHLGARLAFERTGVRIYEAMIGKLQALGEIEEGPSIADLEAIQRDERGHFHFLQELIAHLGGDPTALTPAADIQATLGKGAVEVVIDPRTDVLQALNALLLVELADNVSWSGLAEIAHKVGADEIAGRLDEAHRSEQRHLVQVERWMSASMQATVAPNAKQQGGTEGMKNATAERIVDVPVEVAYNQWMQFESFPRFMEGIEEVRQIDDRRYHWTAKIGGVTREWDAEITEQIPNRLIAWQGIDGFPNQGTVTFDPVGANQTRVILNLAYETEGLPDKIADFVGLIDGIAEKDVEKFKDYVEHPRAAA